MSTTITELEMLNDRRRQFGLPALDLQDIAALRPNAVAAVAVLEQVRTTEIKPDCRYLIAVTLPAATTAFPKYVKELKKMFIKDLETFMGDIPFKVVVLVAGSSLDVFEIKPGEAGLGPGPGSETTEP